MSHKAHCGNKGCVFVRACARDARVNTWIGFGSGSGSELFAIMGVVGIETRALTETQALRLSNFLTAAGTEPPLSKVPSVAELAEHPGVSSNLLDALDVRPQMLLGAGATLAELTTLGYGAAHMVKDIGLTTQCVRTFGKTETATAVLVNVEDAACLAGTHAASVLGLSPRMLLLTCGGDRACAEHILACLFRQEAEHTAAHNAADPHDQNAALSTLRSKLRCGPLHGVPVEVLAGLGIDGIVLRDRFGIQLEQLASTLGCAIDDLAVLGVMVRS